MPAFFAHCFITTTRGLTLQSSWNEEIIFKEICNSNQKISFVPDRNKTRGACFWPHFHLICSDRSPCFRPCRTSSKWELWPESVQCHHGEKSIDVLAPVWLWQAMRLRQRPSLLNTYKYPYHFLWFRNRWLSNQRHELHSQIHCSGLSRG